MLLKFPLHCYDEAGRMKPPVFLYILLLFVCRGLILLVISLSFREDSERLLRIFYPLPYHFYLSLIPILPAIFGLYLVSKRTILWKEKKFFWFKLLPFLLYLALLLDAAIQLYMLEEIEFAYSMSHGFSLLIAFCGILYMSKSKYFRELIVDWALP